MAVVVVSGQELSKTCGIVFTVNTVDAASSNKAVIRSEALRVAKLSLKNVCQSTFYCALHQTHLALGSTFKSGGSRAPVATLSHLYSGSVLIRTTATFLHLRGLCRRCWKPRLN